MQNWWLPLDTDENALASVAVSLDDDYKVTAIEILESNGTQIFDESIKRAIMGASPFRELRGLDDNDRENFRQLRFHFVF